MAVDLGQILGQVDNRRKRKNRIRDPLTGSGGLGGGIGPTGGGMGGGSHSFNPKQAQNVLQLMGVGQGAGASTAGKGLMKIIGAMAASDLNLKINIKTINNALSQFR